MRETRIRAALPMEWNKKPPPPERLKAMGARRHERGLGPFMRFIWLREWELNP